MTWRRERINELIRKELSELLRREVKDPRLRCMVTVTEVVSSQDIRRAKVFVSVMGTDDEKKEALQGMRAAVGFLRRELGERLTLRYIPELIFQRDDSIEQGGHLLQLIEQVTGESSPEEVAGEVEH